MIRFHLLLSIVLVVCSTVHAQDSKELPAGYYVVVAAYAPSKEGAAIAYVNKLTAEGDKASYGLNSGRNLYFVYLNYFTSLKEGVRDMLDTRKEGKFTDAWVRVVHGDIPELLEEAPVASAPSTPDVPPATSLPTKEERENSSQLPPEPAEEQAPPASVTDTLQPADEIVQYDPMTLGNTEVFLSVFNAANNRIIDGEVEVVDSERSRMIEKVRANEYLTLPDPKSNSGQLTLIAHVFGYRPVQHEFNFKRPLADTVHSYVDLMGTNFVVNFDMVRYRKGDVAVLYQVFFYNDAAVMLPESKFQLNDLMQLMKENGNYRIRLHGHTNGNYHGKIVARGPEGEFFALNSSNIETTGSAKRLSELRAEVIKDYLIANGVEGSRIEIRAWGGKKPLYDKTGANAKKNVRVEVEVLQE